MWYNNYRKSRKESKSIAPMVRKVSVRMANIYMVREVYNDDWNTDIRFYSSAEQAYLGVKRVIDESFGDKPEFKRIKKECYEELDTNYAANPENFCVEEVAFASKVVIVDNLIN